VIASKGWAEPSEIALKIKETRDEIISIQLEDDMYRVYVNEEFQFAVGLSNL